MYDRWVPTALEELNKGDRVRLTSQDGDVHEVTVSIKRFNGLKHWIEDRSHSSYGEDDIEDWAVEVQRPQFSLATLEPGTVIAIGGWWLTRLRPYEGNPPAWELHPANSLHLGDLMVSQGIKTQCVYGDDWVLAEIEQEGSFQIIAKAYDFPVTVTI